MQISQLTEEQKKEIYAYHYNKIIEKQGDSLLYE